jgi:O-antigen ligase
MNDATLRPRLSLSRQTLVSGARAVGFVAASLAVGVYAGRYSTTYVLPAIIALLLVGFALTVPEWCFLALLALTPFSFRFFLPNRSEVFVPSEPLVAALVGAYILDRAVARVRGSAVEPFPLGKPLLFFAFVTLLSVSQSPFPFDSTKGALRAVAYILVTLPMYALMLDTTRLIRAIRVAVVTGFAATLVMIAILTTRLDILSHSEAFRGTLFGNYAVYGSFVTVFLLPLIARSLFDTSAYDRVRHGAMLAVFGVGMLLCLSRGAWLSFLCGAAFLLFPSSRLGARRKWTFVGVGFATLVLLLLTPGVSDMVRARAGTVLRFDFASNHTRLLRWGFALLMFLQNPVLGGGYGTFALVYRNESFLGDPGRYQLGAHSEHLQILAEMGIVGFIAWVWLWTAFFVRAYRIQKRLRDPFWRSLVIGLTAYQVAFLIHFVVGNFLEGDRVAVPFWFAMAAVPAIGRIADAEDATT